MVALEPVLQKPGYAPVEQYAEMPDMSQGAWTDVYALAAVMHVAVCGRPQLLFLDEPTTGLDIDARQGLWRAIRELAAQGCAVLLTTHYLEEAEALADRVMVIDHGRLLAQGTVEEMRARVSQRRIGCVSALAPAQVAAWAGVQEARIDADGRLQVIAAQAEPVVRRLLAEDPSLSELEVRRAGLADAFLALTARPGTPMNAEEAA